MQIGIFTVGDVTTDPTTGRTPTEYERIKATVAIARKAEEVGLDVFATGEHHNPPFIASNPTATLAYIGAQTERIILSTATTLITTTDPVLIAEDYAKIQHLLDGRVDLMMGRGNTGPVYPWFGKDIRDGIPLAIENYALLRRLWREDVVELGRQAPHPAAGLHLHAAAAGRRPAVRVARLDPLPRDRRAGGVLRRRLLPQPHLLAGLPHQADGRPVPPALRAPRARPRGHRDRRSRRTVLHAQEQPGRGERVPPLLRQRPRLRARPVAGGLHAADAAHRRLPAAGARAHPGVPRLRRPLPAPAVPARPRRPAAEDRAGAARPARRDPSRDAQGVRRGPSATRPRRARPTPPWSPPPAAARTPPCTPRPTT